MTETLHPVTGDVTHTEGPGQIPDRGLRMRLTQMLKPSARICSRPSGVIFSAPRRHPDPVDAEAVDDAVERRRDWSSMTSVSGQAADVSVMSMTAVFVWSMTTP